MAVNPAVYRPTLFDEHLHMLDIDGDGDRDATLCRASATAMALDGMTAGEWTTTEKGERWGAARIRATLKAMRYATGEPKRPGYNQSHTDEFVKACGFDPDIIRIFNKPWADIKVKLSEGFMVTMAGDVAGTPTGSPLRRYVRPGVGHEILLTRINSKGDTVFFIDPMTPHGTEKYERSAPASHFFGFGKRFRLDGNNIAEIWKRGKLMRHRVEQQENLATITRLRAERRTLESTIDELEQEVDACEPPPDLSADIARLDQAIGALKVKLGL